MFTRKYVGPAECASCDKNIVNLNGMRSEHLSWNKLPFKEPNERIAKVSFCDLILVRTRIQSFLASH